MENPLLFKRVLLWSLAIVLSRILACLVYTLTLKSLAIVLLWILACIEQRLLCHSIIWSLSIRIALVQVSQVSLVFLKSLKSLSTSSWSSSSPSSPSSLPGLSGLPQGLQVLQALQVSVKHFKTSWHLPHPLPGEPLQVHQSKPLYHLPLAKPLKFVHPRPYSQSPWQSP